MMERRIRDFGPKSMFETVHEAGDAYEEAILELNKVAREDADMAVVGAPWMKVRIELCERRGQYGTNLFGGGTNAYGVNISITKSTHSWESCSGIAL